LSVPSTTEHENGKQQRPIMCQSIYTEIYSQVWKPTRHSLDSLSTKCSLNIEKRTCRHVMWRDVISNYNYRKRNRSPRYKRLPSGTTP